jgi:glycosyltransferase involved in cell wall biosynthesis
MKILQVVPYFHPAYAFGGPVKVAYSISKELVKRGHSVTVYTTDIKSQTERLNVPNVMDVDGIEVHYMRNLFLAPVRMSNLFLSPELILTCKSELPKFDLVHLHEFTTFQNIVVSHYSKKYGVPYVLQAHGSIPIIGRKGRKLLFNAMFGNKILRNASKVFALTNIEKMHYQLRGFTDEKITIIPNGIDLSDYEHLPPKGSFKKEFRIQSGKKIILYLGRLHKTKGIRLLINAYAYLVKTLGCKDTLLVIAGPDDGYLNEVISLVTSLGISDSVLFTGFIDNEDKLAALVDANVFVTPSFYGFPMTFLEACAVGIPIVTTMQGDSLEWINGNVGSVTPSTYNELAEALRLVISDVELAHNFSVNCKKTVGTLFSIEKIVDRIEHVYSEVARASDWN